MPYSVELSMIDYSNIFLPVQSLNKEVVRRALDIKSLYEDMNIDVETNDLSNDILFEEEHDRIRNTAEIRNVDRKHQITFSLTFGQFLWSVGVYLSTYFDNCIQIPMMDRAGSNIYGYKFNKNAVDFAQDTFYRAKQLIYCVKRDAYVDIPNICDPQVFKDEIGKANGIYIGGMVFIMAHEISHSYLGHTHYPDNKELCVDDEIAADDMAIGYLSEEFDGEWGWTYKIGIANVLCALLLMGQDTISSDGAHPHMDVRIANIMGKLNLPHEDILWGYVGCAIRLWLLVYGEYTIEEDSKIKGFDTYGDFYDYYLGLLKAYRQRKFPDVVKPNWYVE